MITMDQLITQIDKIKEYNSSSTSLITYVIPAQSYI